MINKREYKTPNAEITVFECADVITTSLKIKPDSAAPEGKSYIHLHSAQWNDGFKQNQ